MCGITGYHSLVPRDSSWQPPDLVSMTRRLAHRGPDDEGFLEAAGSGIGMRRLSVIDLETGHQPISNETGDVAVVTNGEIYNYRELRDQLRDRGHTFATASDTEVLVHAFEEWGEAMVGRLRGMFAFAILDRRDPRDPRLLLARDHCGIKPLYYVIVDDTLCFASEIKSLLTLPALDRRLDLEALDAYLSFLYVPEPRTIFRGISALLPGHVLTCRRGPAQTRCFWRFGDTATAYRSRQDAIEHVREVFADSVEAMLVADVPLGLFLSGGIDSVSILAMMSRQGLERVKTFSIGFGPDAGHWDELDAARDAATAFGSDHQEFRLTPDVVSLLPHVVAHFDQPFANPTAIILWLLSEHTRQHVTVALAGTGGDELFAGYPRHVAMHLRRHYGKLPARLRRSLARGARRTLTGGPSAASWRQRIRRFLETGSLADNQAYAHLVTVRGPELRSDLYSSALVERLRHHDPTGFLLEHLQDASPERPSRFLSADVHTYLPFNQLAYGDRMSMAHGLEVRVPFIDQRLLEVAAGIPLAWHLRGGVTKALFREAMTPYLPPQVLKGRKRGLNLPIALWFRGALQGWLTEMLSTERLEQRGFFSVSTVESIRRQHVTGYRDHSLLLWAMVTLEAWCQQYVDEQPPKT